MSKLIIEEYPLLVLPSLASKIGLNEAIALQQIHYWLNPNINKNYKEGAYWIYNTYEEWQKQFSFWSVRTIRRIMQSLDSKGLLISKKFNFNNFDKTKWYTINYSILEALSSNKTRTGQLGHSKCPDWTEDKVKLAASYKDTETTTKTTNNSLSSFDNVIEGNFNTNDVKEREMINIWNRIFKENNTVIDLTKSRSILLYKFLNSYFSNDIGNWEVFCLKITTSKFLMGKVTNFKVSIDWVLKEENIVKILENNYGIENNLVIIDATETELEEKIIDPIWKKIRVELRNKLGEGIFQSWISKIEYSHISDQVVYFKTPTKFIREWIDSHFSEDIKRAFNSSGINVKQIFVQ